MIDEQLGFFLHSFCKHFPLYCNKPAKHCLTGGIAIATLGTRGVTHFDENKDCQNWNTGKYFGMSLQIILWYVVEQWGHWQRFSDLLWNKGNLTPSHFKTYYWVEKKTKQVHISYCNSPFLTVIRDIRCLSYNRR